jgi:hypothetical protein
MSNYTPYVTQPGNLQQKKTQNTYNQTSSTSHSYGRPANPTVYTPTSTVPTSINSNPYGQPSSNGYAMVNPLRIVILTAIL